VKGDRQQPAAAHAIACHLGDCYKTNRTHHPKLEGSTTLSRSIAVRNAVLKAIGLVFVALGFVGVFVPLLPTTPFLLIAGACFARSSPAFHRWLFNHRILGHYVRDWEKNRSIPLSAKILAVVTMSASLAWLALATNAPSIAVWTTGAILACVAAWLVTRPTSKL
jgi:uncharacterized membrane protein YbaN (DUF454 family)